MRVLIIDTSIAIIQRLIDLISDLEFISAIDTSLNYADGSTKVKSNPPDAVLLDMEHPAKKSFEFLAELKNQNRGISVIVLSDIAIKGIKEKCFSQGVDHFIDKYSEFDRVPSLLEKIHLNGMGSNKN